jgi:diaminopimelate decarboxylase
MNLRINTAIHTLKNAAQKQTPLCAYIYDLQSLANHATGMVQALPKNCELYYAAKANPEAKILATLAPIFDGFEAASGGELAWLNRCQPDVPLIFGGPGKLIGELEQAINLGVQAIHVESLTELHRIEQICLRSDKICRVMLRMNISLQGLPSTKLTMGGKPTPFGFDESELALVLETIKCSKNIVLQGFHFHLMSHQLDSVAHLALMALYFKTFKHWCALYQLDVPVLNVGGGIGIDYARPEKLFDWQAFCADLNELIVDFKLSETTIRFECGRYVTANCGYYVMEVLDIKQNHGQYFAIGHGGTHHFRTPAAQNHDHPFFVCAGDAEQSQYSGFSYPEIKQQTVTLVGQLCTPKDVLASQQYVESLAIGDYLVFSQAGAYAWNISHQNFLMHAPPLIHFID